MGYCMNQRDSKFNIKSRNKNKALAAIKTLMSKVNELGGGGSYSGGKCNKKWFSWVTTETVVNAKTLKEAMQEWRWEINCDAKGNVDSICFASEKLGDDNYLLEAIAPYVVSGSWIDMEGEDGSIWRWEFKNGKVKEIAGRVCFDA